jgi:hypothetical protein
MKTGNERTHFAGLDWASDHHDVAVVDQQGKVVAEFRIDHRAAGWAVFPIQPKAAARYRERRREG